MRDFVLAQRGRAASSWTPTPPRSRPVLEGYQRENKSHSIVAIGCTGGKHRSVVDGAKSSLRRLAAVPGVAVRVKHRDLGRE